MKSHQFKTIAGILCMIACHQLHYTSPWLSSAWCLAGLIFISFAIVSKTN